LAVAIQSLFHSYDLPLCERKRGIYIDCMLWRGRSA
jgi:hypothetical protein